MISEFLQTLTIGIYIELLYLLLIKPDMNKEVLAGIDKVVDNYRKCEIKSKQNSFVSYLYNIIVSSLKIDRCSITLQEARVLFDCGVMINGVSGVECRFAKSLRDAYWKMLKFVDNKNGFSVDIIQDIANTMMSGCDSYEQCNKQSFINGNLKFDDNALIVYKMNSKCACCKEDETAVSKLVDLCEVINSEIANIQADDFKRQYALGCWVHNMVLKHEFWGEFSGRMARLLMHWVEFSFNLPIVHFGNEVKEYLEAVKQCAVENDVRPLNELTYSLVLDKTLDDFVKFGGFVVAKRPKDAKKPGRRRVALPIKAVYNKLCEDNKVTARSIAVELGLDQQHVVRALNELKLRNKIMHVGSNKCGYWEVIG